MSFISIYMLTGPLPAENVGSRYRRSRRMIGFATLILVINYCVHLFVNPRFTGYKDWAIYMNLCTYFIELPLFFSALMTFMDPSYYDRFKTVWKRHFITCTSYVLLSLPAMFIFPEKRMAVLIVLVCLFWCYAIPIGYRLYKCYRKMALLIRDTQSDDIEAKVKWMSVAAFCGILYGVSCGYLTFLPNNIIYIWVLISIPYYVFLFVSYEGYLIFENRVQKVLNTEEEIEYSDTPSDEEVLSNYYKEKDNQTSVLIEKWIESYGFTEKGLTIDVLASYLFTNRTYLSGYLHRTIPGKHFREWINELRLEYAKEMMMSDKLMPLIEIADRAGYSSLSHFTTTFSRSVGYSPAKWRTLN